MERITKSQGARDRKAVRVASPRSLPATGIPCVRLATVLGLLLLFHLFLAMPATTGPRPKSWLALQLCRIGSEGSQPGDSSEKGCSRLRELLVRAAGAGLRAGTPAGTIERLNRFFFEEEGFRVNFDLTTPEHLLPDRVLAGKKGYCVGLAALYLAIAEELRLPIHAVVVPKHLFLRWDDGNLRRNIELFQDGREISDEAYIREHRIPPESIEQGVFLANLTTRQFLGLVYQNLGALESQRGDFEASGRAYARALRHNPRLAAAYYNRGNDELEQRRYRRAIRDYTKALRLYPTDVWALRNRGLAWKGLGEMERAEQDWQRASEIESAPGGIGPQQGH